MSVDSPESVSGAYYLQGVRETGSGFLLKPDQQFEFFYTYGALDRYGSGNWSVKDDKVFLQSRKKPESDFALLESKRSGSGSVSIRMKESNEHLLKYVYVSLEEGAEGTWQPMNSAGEVQFPKIEFKSICLLLEWCPERFSIVSVADPSHDDFAFRFEPWIFEVFLDNFPLTIIASGLSGMHPLLEGDFQYRKEGE